MPDFLNYGSTGRPPGEYLRQYHLRHSLKMITDILESPYPPFDIFSIDNNNNNTYIIVCSDNRDITAAAAFNDYYNDGGVLHGTSHLFGGHFTVQGTPREWDRTKLRYIWYNVNKYNTNTSYSHYMTDALLASSRSNHVVIWN
jgi:hypothetical protein